MIDPNALKRVTTLENGSPVLRLGYKAKRQFAKKLGWTPFDKQKLVMKSMARTRLVCAGARFGKSAMVQVEVAPELMLPNRDWWLVAEEYGLCEFEFEYIWKATVEHPDPELRNYINSNIEHKTNNSKIGQMWIKFKWGSSVVCKSTAKPTSLLGAELDGAVLCEGSQIPKWIVDKYLDQRLASRMGQLLIPTTPNGYDEMLYPRFLKGQQKELHYSEKKDNYVESHESWEFKSIDSPYYPRENYEIALKKVEAGEMDEATFGEQFEGRFTSNTGLVYKNFNTRTHVIEPFDIPEDWPLIRAVDVGMDAPTVCLWGRVDPVGAIVITDEYYQEGVDVLDHARRILAKTGDTPVAYTHIDPAASQRTAANSKSAMQQYIEAGIPCIPADNSVDAGIMRVTEYLRHEKNEDGEFLSPPKLFIFNNCGNLIEEFGKYVWSRKKGDNTKTNKPVKRDDHGMDALRYMCMSRPYFPYQESPRNMDPDSFEFILRRNKRQKMKIPDLGHIG